MGSKIHEAPLERVWMEEGDSEIQTCSHLIVPCAATEGRSLLARRPGLASPSATHLRAVPLPPGPGCWQTQACFLAVSRHFYLLSPEALESGDLGMSSCLHK